MSLELSPEQRIALSNTTEPCLHLHDPQTNKVYLLIEQGVEPEIETAHLDYMRSGLKLAAEQAAQGLAEPWNRETIRAGGKKKLDASKRLG